MLVLFGVLCFVGLVGVLWFYMLGLFTVVVLDYVVCELLARFRVGVVWVCVCCLCCVTLPYLRLWRLRLWFVVSGISCALRGFGWLVVCCVA